MPPRTPKSHRKSSSQKPDQSIGLVLKAARLEKGLSQIDLANLLGYDSGQFISDWERGHSAIPMKRLAELALLLDLDRDHLFDLLLEFSIERLADSLRQEYRKSRGAGSRAKS